MLAGCKGLACVRIVIVVAPTVLNQAGPSVSDSVCLKNGRGAARPWQVVMDSGLESMDP